MLLLAGAALGGGLAVARFAPDPLGTPARRPQASAPDGRLRGPQTTGWLRPLLFSPVVDADGRPVPAPAVLDQLAVIVAGLPDDAGHGRYAYVELKVWTDLGVSHGANDGPTPNPMLVRAWRAADGSGLISTVEDGQPDTDAATQVLYPGEYPDDWKPRELATTPRALAEQLVPLAYRRTAQSTVTEFEGLFRNQPVRPKVRAAVLRLLAGISHLVMLGAGQDRQGRPGLAFAVHDDQAGLPVQRVIILDPYDGRILGSEVLNLPDGSVWTSTVWLASTFTDRLT